MNGPRLAPSSALPRVLNLDHPDPTTEDLDWFGRELNRHADRAARAVERARHVEGLLRDLLVELEAVEDAQCELPALVHRVREKL